MSENSAADRKLGAQRKRIERATQAHDKAGQRITVLENQRAKAVEKVEQLDEQLTEARADAVQAEKVVTLETEHHASLERYYAGKAGDVDQAPGFVEPEPEQIPQQEA